MSEPKEIQENFFVKDRGERAYYEAAKPEEEILLPITRDGFETIVKLAAESFEPPLPINESMKTVVAGYVHHIGNDQHTTSIKKLSSVMYKSIANALTWTIDQEIKEKRKAEQQKAALEAKLVEEERLKQEALLKAEAKREKKASKFGVVPKQNESEASTTTN